MLQENALEIVKKMKIPDFKTSNAWLEKFRTRHSIVIRMVTWEAGYCAEIEKAAWMKTHFSIVEGYEKQNIFNCNETGILFQALFNKTLCIKSISFNVGEHTKKDC